MPRPRKIRPLEVDKITQLQPTHEPELIRLWALRLAYLYGGLERSCSRHRFCGVTGIWQFLLGEDWTETTQQYFDESEIANIRPLLKKHHNAAEKRCRKLKTTSVVAQNLQQLSALVGLSDTEYKLLLFTVLAKLETPLEHACRLLDDLSLRETGHILAGTLGLDEKEVNLALSYRSKLAKTGLLGVDRDRRQEIPDRLELLSRSFADRMGTDLITHTGEYFCDIVQQAPAPTLSAEQYLHVQHEYQLARQYLQHALDENKAGVNVLVHGMPGTGKTEMARLLAQALDCTLLEVACQGEDNDSIAGKNRLQAYKAAQSFFTQQRTLILFDEIQDIFEDGGMFGQSTAQSRKAEINHLLESNPLPSLWLSNSTRCLDNAFLRRFDLVIDMRIPPLGQRTGQLQEAIGNLPISDKELHRFAEHPALAPALIERSVKVVQCVKGSLPAERIAPTLEMLFNNTLEAQGHQKIRVAAANSLPDYYDPRFINADVDLAELAEGILQHPAARLCLYGPPGTGKSAFALWMAQQICRPLHSKKISDLVSMWVGGTEKNIARAFEEAGRDNAVLLLDEVDSFLADRRQAQRSWESTQVNEMLTQMEAFSGLFIASTNLIDNLDAASMRRFDLKVKFDYLRATQATELFERQCDALQIRGLEPQLLSEVARIGTLTPGDFATVARQHRFRRLGNAWQMLEALQHECAMKEGAAPRRIGFVH